MRLNKIGQVTPFIIVGIIIVIVAVLLIFLYKPEGIGVRLSVGQVDSIRVYIEDCIKENLDENLFLLKRNAGHYRRIGKDNIYFLSYLTAADWKHNDILGNEISEEIVKKLKRDCSLDVFNQYKIETGDIKVETKIGWHNIMVNVVYPVTIIKGDSKLELNKFSVSKMDEFGIMNAVAAKIINDEIYNGGFDMTHWKENSIFKGEAIDISKQNVEGGGIIFVITSVFDNNRYAFII